jgi:hypothetical protein
MSILISLIIAAILFAVVYYGPIFRYIVMCFRVCSHVCGRAVNDHNALTRNNLGYHEIYVDNERFCINRSDLCEMFIDSIAESLSEEFGAVSSRALVGERTTVFMFKNPTNDVYHFPLESVEE